MPVEFAIELAWRTTASKRGAGGRLIARAIVVAVRRRTGTRLQPGGSESFTVENLLQRSRFELKYIIGEPTAHEIRHFARNHLMPDPFANPARGYAYNIYSVYLDSTGLSLMNQTLEGLRNRFKLRVRFYDGNPEHPVFFEIKRRVNDAIVKVRAKVRRDAAHRLMYARDSWPERSDLANPADDRGFAALCKFCDLRDKLMARPQVVVGYNREAWCAPEDDSIRLTFDRVLEAAPYHPDHTFSLFRDDQWVRVPMPGVVLELKFTDRFPNWMREVAQTFNLRRTSMAKYVTCATSMAPEGLAMIRDAEAVRAVSAARRWEQQHRTERERAVVEGQGQAAPSPALPSSEAHLSPLSPALAPVPASVPVPIPLDDRGTRQDAWASRRGVAW